MIAWRTTAVLAAGLVVLVACESAAEPARHAVSTSVAHAAEPADPPPSGQAAPRRAPAQEPAAAEPERRAPQEQQQGGDAPTGSTSKASSEPPSVSRGYPNDGTLEHGARLPLSTEALRFNPNRHSVARFATREVIDAITRAAQVVHDELPGGRLTVNDLSLEGGGPIAHHGSHRNGRDADTLFYLLDDDEQPIESVGAPLDPRGYGHDYKDLSTPEDDVRLHLDAPRTWRFVQALLEDPVAQVQRIFVVEHVRSMLLDEARRQDAPEATRERFAAVTCQPGMPHDDHLHIRWFCDPADIPEGCQDMHPIYPWHRAWLAERGAKPVLAKRWRKPPPAKKVSHEEARQQAERRSGGLHPSVRAFLERRKAWSAAPHPGRRWCR